LTSLVRRPWQTTFSLWCVIPVSRSARGPVSVTAMIYCSQRCEEKGLEFRYTDASGSVHALTILELHDTVSSTVLSRKGDRVTITLNKASEFPWYELAKKK
jgi:hypothetical protein